MASHETPNMASHEEAVDALIDKADDYARESRWSQAVHVLLEAVAESEEHLGSQHEMTLIAKTILAFNYRQLGKYHDAEAQDRAVLEARRLLVREVEEREAKREKKTENKRENETESKGENETESKRADESENKTGPEKDEDETKELYTSVAKSLNNVALDVKGAGRYEDGLALEREAADLMERYAGRDSPRTATSWHNLANSYYKAGRFAEAAALHEDVLAVRRRVLGPGHPETIMAMDMLALDCLALQDASQAVALQEEAVVEAKEHLGLQAPTTLKCMVNLANSYLRIGGGETGCAVATLEEAWDAYRSKNEDEKEDNALSVAIMNALAVAYFQQDRFADARPLLERCYAWNRQVLGPDHRQTQASRRNVEAVLEELGVLERADIISLPEQTV